MPSRDGLDGLTKTGRWPVGRNVGSELPSTGPNRPTGPDLGRNPRSPGGDGEGDVVHTS